MPRLWFSHALSFAALVALAWVAYRSGLGTFFLNEDFIWLYRCRLDEHQSLLGLLTRDVMQGSYSWRPLVQVWFGLNFAELGWNAFGYHVQAWALHVAAALCVYLLALEWRGPGFALLSALLFAVHPVHVESLTWASAIGGPLSTLPAVAALCVWQRQCRAPSGPTVLGSSLAGFLFLVALAAQENTLILLLWLPLFSTQFKRAEYYNARTAVVWLVPLFVAVMFAIVRLWQSPASWSPPAATLPFLSQAAWHDSLAHMTRNFSRALDSLVPIGIQGAGVALHVFAIGAAGWRATRGDWLPLVASACFTAAILPYTTLFFGIAPRYFHLPLVAWAIAMASLLWPAAGLVRSARRAGVACFVVLWLAALLPRIQNESHRFEQRSKATLDLLREIHRALPQVPPGAELAFAGLGEWRLQHDAFVFGLEEALRLVYRDDALRVRFVPLGTNEPGAVLLIWNGKHFQVLS